MRAMGGLETQRNARGRFGIDFRGEPDQYLPEQLSE